MAQPLSIIKRSLSTSAVRGAIKNVTVIGGGLMGSGIAQVFVSYFFLNSLPKEKIYKVIKMSI